jgi:hypothetical protein
VERAREFFVSMVGFSFDIIVVSFDIVVVRSKEILPGTERKE